MDSLVSDEEAAREQAVFDEHQKKTMEYIDRLEDLLAKPQPDVPSPLSTNNRLVDRHLDSLEDSARDNRRAVETRACSDKLPSQDRESGRRAAGAQEGNLVN